MLCIKWAIDLYFCFKIANLSKKLQTYLNFGRLVMFVCGLTMLLDNVNLQIIDILSKNSLTPFVEIAKQIGISDATVHLRIRRLKDEGVISKFTLCLDNNLLGYDHLAFVGINVRPGFTDEVTEGLSNLDEILEIHELHNEFDLLLKIRAKGLNHMRDIIGNRIGTLPNIVKTELMTALKTNKEEQGVPLKQDGSDNGKDGATRAKESTRPNRMHEHEFITNKTGYEISVICSTCGLLYCEKCGKLTNKIANI
jgi:Lrp/AsnC family transcriptional regulator, regulator for asnA, asnC and gidA